jgi:hypothetical protein
MTSLSPATDKDPHHLWGDHSINIAHQSAMLFSSLHLQAFLYKPYEDKAFHSDVKNRQKRKTPEGVYACWEINTSHTAWNDTIPCCAPCRRFKAEKVLTPCLMKLKSNRDSVRAYQCDTFWQAFSDKTETQNEVSPGSFASEQPPKRCIVSLLVPQIMPPSLKNICSVAANLSVPAQESRGSQHFNSELQSICEDL